MLVALWCTLAYFRWRRAPHDEGRVWGAVLGGSFISKYTSEKTVGLVGGTLFLLFALTTALGTF